MKKFVTVLLALTFAVSALGACNKNKIDPNDPQKLEIYVYNAGYGYEWCEKILNAFKEEDWVKEKYPDLKTSFTKDELSTTAQEMITAGKKVNKYEVLFGTNLESYLGPDAPVVDLTDDIYDSQVPGENVKFSEKMIPSYLASAAYKGKSEISEDKYYQVNWASGMGGLIYNEDKLNALGFSVPNTTDELVDIMSKVKELNGTNSAYKQTTSFATYGASAYVNYLYYTWWAQYQTSDEYINFYNGIDTETQSRSPAIFRQTGLLRTLELLESFLVLDKGYTWLNPNTGREAFRETQNRVQLGNALFMANGDWVDNELKVLRDGLIEMGHADTVKMMRTPIISSIIELTPTINDDATLSKVVKAIDEGKTSYESVSADDFTRIAEARRIVYSIGPSHCAYIPEYASGKEVAIDFLRYLATDKANKIYIKETNGASMPFSYDVMAQNHELFESLSPMQQDRLNYFAEQNVNVLPSQNSFPLVRYGGLSVMASGRFTTDFTGGSSKGNYGSIAEMIFEREYKYWTDGDNANWKGCLIQSGL